MSLIRTLARPMLGAGFIVHGVDRLRNTPEAAEALEPTLEEVGALVPQAEPVTGHPQRTTQVLGGVQVVAGAALAIGKFPRLAALTLVGVHKLDTYAEFRTARAESADGAAVRTGLLKNLGILGGLGLAVVDLDGRPSLSWRAEHLAKTAKGSPFSDKTHKIAEQTGGEAVKTLKAYQKAASKGLKNAEREARQAVAAVAEEAKKKTEAAS